jgi:PAS domain-containing protein
MHNEEQNLSDPEVLRRNAEERLKKNPAKKADPGMESDTKRLVHELQVHQIELEMQNEELKKANEITENALKKYTMLYDFAPMGYLTLDAEGTICDLNFTAAEMMGEKRFSLENSNFKIFVSEESKPVFNKFFKDVFSNQSKESCEILLGYNGTPLCYVYLEGIVIGEEHRCLLSAVDISGFKKNTTH